MSEDTAKRDGTPHGSTGEATGATEATVERELLIEAVDIHKEYRLGQQSVSVLKGISLDIVRGEILAILGHSGVGKSTLLNLLGLLDTPTRGQILYRGPDPEYHDLDLAALPPSRKAAVRNRKLGFVFQFYHLLPDLSVFENVVLPVMIRHGRRQFRRDEKQIRARAGELLDRVGLTERRDFPPTRLSGGERQRAAIARALVNEPEVVYCDEPTGNLDMETGARIHELMLELNRETGITFILVTHDEDLASLADRKLRMVDGLFR